MVKHLLSMPGDGSHCFGLHEAYSTLLLLVSVVFDGLRLNQEKKKEKRGYDFQESFS